MLRYLFYEKIYLIYNFYYFFHSIFPLPCQWCVGEHKTIMTFFELFEQPLAAQIHIASKYAVTWILAKKSRSIYKKAPHARNTHRKQVRINVQSCYKKKAVSKETATCPEHTPQASAWRCAFLLKKKQSLYETAYARNTRCKQVRSNVPSCS